MQHEGDQVALALVEGSDPAREDLGDLSQVWIGDACGRISQASAQFGVLLDETPVDVRDLEPFVSQIQSGPARSLMCSSVFRSSHGLSIGTVWSTSDGSGTRS